MFGCRKLRWLGAGAAAAGAALLAGCTTSAPSATSVPPAPTSAASTTTPATVAPVSTAATTAAPASTAGAPTAPTSGGGGEGCASRDLRADAGTTQAAAGSVYQVIVFTNIGSTPCTLYGYPGVSLAAGSPVTQVGAAADRTGTDSPQVVTLAASGQASALLRITQALNYSADQCHPQATTYLQIYPPNQTTPLYLAYKSTGCALASQHLLEIGVVKPGTAG